MGLEKGMTFRRIFHNFTLVELLVVITIIVILASLLLPALGKTRQKAREIGCVSNMKQVSVHAMSYVNDYDGRMLPVYVNASLSPIVRYYWNYVLTKVCGYDTRIPGTGKCVCKDYSTCGHSDYTVPSYFTCPGVPMSAHPHIPVNGNVFDFYTYGMNWRFPDNTYYDGVNYYPIARCKSPSSYIYLADSGGSYPYAVFDPAGYSSTGVYYLVTLRHFHRANALFLDGHCGSNSKGELSKLGVYFMND